MDKILDLRKYRRKKKAAWLNTHGTQLDRFIEAFVNRNIETEYHEIASLYQSSLSQNAESTWDYRDLREIIRDAIEEMFGDSILDQLKNQWWAKAAYIDREDIIDRCLSAYILGEGRRAELPSF